MSRGETEYHSKDFEWDQLRLEIESDPSHLYHLLPFQTHENDATPSNSEETQLFGSAQHDSDAWNSFHTRHSTGKFFKERRYLLKEFPELASLAEHSNVLEVGCGNGSTALSLLRGVESINIFACDCSTEALERAKEIIHAADVSSARHRFHPFHCDFSVTGFPKWLACDSCQQNFLQNQHLCLSDDNKSSGADLTSQKQNVNGGNGGELKSLKPSNCCIGGMDFVTLIFTLSAVPFHRMPMAIAECFYVMKPGGLLLFRDYGLYDMTMLRFESRQRVGFREYMRSDGTRSYFFCLDSARNIFTGAGFVELELEYCCVKSVNRWNGKSMRRVWVHGKFQKPL